jgi:hypothetical protein
MKPHKNTAQAKPTKTPEQEALGMAAWLIDDLINGNGIHWSNNIKKLVKLLRSLGYDVEVPAG